ncbi:MAG: hypothetical protein IKB60_00850 [Clostridia bacterium]|nr:hypothetical protein [Clostridia bacterium]
MDIRLEMFSKAVADSINAYLTYTEIDINDVVYTFSTAVLEEIKYIICNMDIEDDFDVVEKIVCIFEKYNIDAGGRHNF